MRPAKASPFGSNGDDRRQWRKQGGAVGAAASRMRAAAKQTLGAATRAVSPKVTERASPAGKSRCAAIGRLFVRAILSLCQSCLSAALPSQSRRKLLASSPRGGAIGMSASFRLDERSTISRKRQCSAVQASDSLTRSVVQKSLPPQARPALLRPVEPQSSSRK